ncbi:DNA-directed RNA polymerase II subunit rpb1 [Geranomyces variabilis]|nr:DNA-directed RNA polymerase II subunit rpb1 [Geranomyces variabilis]
MQHLVNNCPEYPSANYVIKGQTNVRVDLRSAPKKPKFELNDIVERRMVTGDLVLFNRQPTLHKMSMMAHRARVMEWQTFRLNVNVCASYNAYFDGDGDAIVSESTAKSITDIVTEQQSQSADTLKKFASGTMLPQGNLSLDETKEQKMQMISAKARDSSGKLANQKLHPENNLRQMVEAGFKGSILNICQIAACVADARGFLSNSFVRDLRPEEMYFAAMGGREGLIDTAVETAGNDSPPNTGPAAPSLAPGRKGLGPEGGGGLPPRAPRDSATVTPQHVPSSATPAKPAQSDDVAPPTDAELDTACGELAAMHLDVAGADIGGMLRKLLHHTSKKRIVEANGAEFLAFNKCLLLATRMPSAFAAAGVPLVVWSQVRRAFGRRALELKPEIAEHSLRTLVNQWHDEINDGATIFALEIHRKNEAAVRLLSCVVNLSQSLRLDDTGQKAKCWTSRS